MTMLLFTEVQTFVLVSRDPKKRRVKPVQKHMIQLDFGLDDSEDDSDYEAPKDGKN